MKKKISDYTTAIYCCRFAINNLLCVEYIKKYRPKKKSWLLTRNKIDVAKMLRFICPQSASFIYHHQHRPEKARLQLSSTCLCLRMCLIDNRYLLLKYFSLLGWNSNRWRMTFIQFVFRTYLYQLLITFFLIRCEFSMVNRNLDEWQPIHEKNYLF